MEEKSLVSPETSDDFGGRNPSSKVADTSVELVGIPATDCDGRIEFSRGNDFMLLLYQINAQQLT